MEFDKVVENRKSVRSFKTKKVEWRDILDAIDSANQAPFASNLNNLKYIIIEEQKTIDKLAELSEQLWINEAPSLVIVCSDEGNMKNLHGEIGRIYSRQQAGAAIENFLLKITEMGLSSCWVGSFDEASVKDLLEIPEKIHVEALLPIGYEKEKSPRKKKKSIESTIYWENWDTSKRPTFIKEPAGIKGYP
jgi:nitroreductase